MSGDLLYATAFALMAFVILVPSIVALQVSRQRKRPRRVRTAPPPGIYRAR